MLQLACINIIFSLKVTAKQVVVCWVTQADIQIERLSFHLSYGKNNLHFAHPWYNLSQ